MKNRYIFAVLMCGLALFAGCQKDELENIPEGAILLTAEGFQSDGSKTSVSGNTVQWVNGDKVKINETEYTVSVTNEGKAYVNASPSSPVYGYYACGTITNPSSTTPTVTIPGSYTCSMSGDRQVIALPMAAYNASGNSTLQFKHLTAAVNVTIWNNTGSTLSVERVVVKSNGNRLNGSVGLNLANDNMGLAASYTDVSAATDSIIEIYFPTPMTIENGESNAKSVQVPILPIASGNITIDVYCNTSSSWLKFSHRASNPALGRNKMLTARAKITAAGTDHVTARRGINLASLSSNYTAVNGDTLYGTLVNNVKISIAADATVTLDGVNINGNGTWTSGSYAGITCNGNANIVLCGNNTVKGFYQSKPGIQPGGTGTTLTIGGTGSLTVSSNGHGAGIGCDYSTYTRCGNITITGGTITAIGSSAAAGIGSGSWNHCGDITITGGTVTAYGGDRGAGIGTGDGEEGYEDEYSSKDDTPSVCGTITISGGIVVAIGGDQGAGIGTGQIGNCGNITIGGSAHVTATKGSGAQHSIGRGVDNDGHNYFPTHGLVDFSVTIGGSSVGYISDSPYTYQP